MIGEFMKRWFQISIWIILVAAILIVFEEKYTAEYYITLFSLIIGLVFFIITLILYLVNKRKEQDGD
jgi:predicted membrane channel-forming protein YqfA (hemolysin III family)